jgi:tetratricopeptide (TPR) repeat protein
MKYSLLLLIVLSCRAQTVQSLTAQIQKTPTAAVYVDRGSAYLTAGDGKNALSDADRALDRDALSLPALLLRGRANTKLGRPAETVTDLSGAIALAPTDATLYLARSAAYAAAGDSKRAQEDRDEALRLDPSAVATLDRQPAVATPSTTPQAVVVATAPAPVPVAPPPPASAKTLSPSTGDSFVAADARYQRGKDLVNLGQTAEGITELDEAIRLQPTNPIFYNTRGYGYYLSKNARRAVEDYDEALRLNPEYLNAVHNRAIARRSLGDLDGANVDRQREIELGKKLGIRIQ